LDVRMEYVPLVVLTRKLRGVVISTTDGSNWKEANKS
jgi:hypothetical protein